jgi:hypothetical protein
MRGLRDITDRRGVPAAPLASPWSIAVSIVPVRETFGSTE